MLQSIRDRAQGWIAWTIVILIVIPFAFWGIQQYFGPDPNVAVAEVDGTEIGLRDFQRTYQRQRQRLQQALGDRFDQSVFTEERIKQQVLRDMVDRVLVTEATRSAGFRVSDAMLRERIQRDDAFVQEGRFSKARYEGRLGRQGMTPQMFEQQVRTDWLSEQLHQGVADTALVTPSELERMLKLRRQQREVAYLRIPAESYVDQVEVGEEAVSAYYDAHRDDYVNPERVTIAYLDLDVEALARQEQVGEELLRQRYEEHRQTYLQPERRRASHILVEVPKDADEAAVEAAREKAQAALDRVNAGEDFAEVAKEVSDDPGSADKGGDLGLFGRGAMVPAFEEAVFSMQEGEVRGPVRSAFGFHVIRLTEVQPEQVLPFEQVRDGIEREVAREQAEQQFYEHGETLANLAYEHPDTLSVAAEALGLEVKTLGPFAREGGQGMAAEPKVIEAAFSPWVLDEGNNSEPMELRADRLVVLRVSAHEPQTQKPLEEVADAIRGKLRRQAAEVRARKDGEAWLDALRNGSDPEALGQEHELEWARPGLVGRRASQVPLAVLDTAFALPHPDGSASWGGTALPGGDYALVQVTRVQDPDPETITQAQRDNRRQQAERALGNAELTAVLDTLRRQAKIKVYEKQLEVQ
jgi:peptidyl-prolyl cis-trans isomerase D